LFFLQVASTQPSVSLNVASTQQSISLNGSLKLNDNSAIRPGENITFHCITLGSSILAWSGTNYVDILELPDGFCVFAGSVFFLRFLFFLQVASTQPSVSLNVASTQQSISLNGSLKLNDNSAIRPGENITFHCITLGSSILAWSGTNYVDILELPDGFCVFAGSVFFLRFLFFLQVASTQPSVSLNVASTQQSISLNGSLKLNDNSAIRPGENITFHCITLGSSILAWSGTNYVDSRI
jgi:hypothetical protein